MDIYRKGKYNWESFSLLGDYGHKIVLFPFSMKIRGRPIFFDPCTADLHIYFLFVLDERPLALLPTRLETALIGIVWTFKEAILSLVDAIPKRSNEF